MGKLWENLKKLESNPEPTPCPVGKLLDRLDPETGATLERILANPRRSTRDIHAALQSAGERIARESVSAHRSGYCRCILTERKFK